MYYVSLNISTVSLFSAKSAAEYFVHIQIPGCLEVSLFALVSRGWILVKVNAVRSSLEGQPPYLWSAAEYPSSTSPNCVHSFRVSLQMPQSAARYSSSNPNLSSPVSQPHHDHGQPLDYSCQPPFSMSAAELNGLCRNRTLHGASASTRSRSAATLFLSASVWNGWFCISVAGIVCQVKLTSQLAA